MKSIKYFAAALFCAVLLTVSCFAAVNVALPSFDVTLNGQRVDSRSRVYPLIVYKDITYFPMTYYDTRFLGLETSWDNDTRTISIDKADTVVAYREYSSGTANGKNDVADVCDFNILVNGKVIENSKEEYPLLVYRDVTYFQLTWHFAAEQFNWDYSFDNDAGLLINSSNETLSKFTLPDMRIFNPSVATDGTYYYYTGTDNRIFRASCSDLSQREVIHTLEYTYYPDTTLVGFSCRDGNIYMSYHIGGASTGTTYRYNINSDGTCERSNEGTYRYGMVGANAYNIDADGFTVERYNSGRVGTTAVYYKFDGSEDYVEIKLDGIRFGEYRDIDLSLNSENGTILGTNSDGNTWFNDPQVLGDSIYLTGYDESSNSSSDLYACDINTGEVKKIANNVGVFYAFSGWDNSVNAMVDMIIYDRAGIRYRYSAHDGKEIEIDKGVRSIKAAVLVGNTGCLAVAGDDGKTSEVRWYDCYGTGSVKNEIFTSDIATEYYTENGHLYAYNSSQSNIKLALFNWVSDYFITSEDAQNVFVSDDALMFTVSDEDGAYVFESRI